MVKLCHVATAQFKGPSGPKKTMRQLLQFIVRGIETDEMGYWHFYRLHTQSTHELQQFGRWPMYCDFSWRQKQCRGTATASFLKKIGRAGVCPVFANVPHRHCTACVSGEFASVCLYCAMSESALSDRTGAGVRRSCKERGYVRVRACLKSKPRFSLACVMYTF